LVVGGGAVDGEPTHKITLANGQVSSDLMKADDVGTPKEDEAISLICN